MEFAAKSANLFTMEGTKTIDPRELLMLTILRILKKLRIDGMPRFMASTHPFTDYFKGFEKVMAVRQLFGEKTEQVLRDLKIELIPIGGYMWVSNADGHIIVSSRYLNKGRRVDIYLDIIHELVHVKQFMEEKELFDMRYSYAERPTEVEAYRLAVEEARRLGFNDKKICQYLRTEWMSDEDFKQLANNLNVKCDE